MNLFKKDADGDVRKEGIKRIVRNVLSLLRRRRSNIRPFSKELETIIEELAGRAEDSTIKWKREWGGTYSRRTSYKSRRRCPHMEERMEVNMKEKIYVTTDKICGMAPDPEDEFQVEKGTLLIVDSFDQGSIEYKVLNGPYKGRILWVNRAYHYGDGYANYFKLPYDIERFKYKIVLLRYPPRENDSSQGPTICFISKEAMSLLKAAYDEEMGLTDDPQYFIGNKDLNWGGDIRVSEDSKTIEWNTDTWGNTTIIVPKGTSRERIKEEIRKRYIGV